MRSNQTMPYQGPEVETISLMTLTNRMRKIEESLDDANEVALSILSKISGGIPGDGSLNKQSPRATGLTADIEVMAEKAYALDALLRDINSRL